MNWWAILSSHIETVGNTDEKVKKTTAAEAFALRINNPEITIQVLEKIWHAEKANPAIHAAAMEAKRLISTHQVTFTADDEIPRKMWINFHTVNGKKVRLSVPNTAIDRSSIPAQYRSHDDRFPDFVKIWICKDTLALAELTKNLGEWEFLLDNTHFYTILNALEGDDRNKYITYALLTEVGTHLCTDIKNKAPKDHNTNIHFFLPATTAGTTFPSTMHDEALFYVIRKLSRK